MVSKEFEDALNFVMREWMEMDQRPISLIAPFLSEEKPEEVLLVEVSFGVKVVSKEEFEANLQNPEE